MSQTLLEAIANRTLLGDGAMGTQLQQAGLKPGGCGEAWNADHPDRILEIQRRYVEAGSDCLITNTFGGCRITLERHGLADRTVEINRQAAQIAREAFSDHASETRPGFVLGDIGPFGGLMEPLGEVPVERVRDALREQAAALVDAGVDAIIIETQTSLKELELGIEAARLAGAACIIGSMAYDVSRDGSKARTMMGIGPSEAAQFMCDEGVDVVALNCGTGIDVKRAARILAEYREVCDLPMMAQPNAGQPVLENGAVHYKQSPDEMASELPTLLASHPNLVGGCCGSGPDHIRKFRERIDQYNASQNPGNGA